MRYMEAEYVGYEGVDGTQKKPRVFRNSLGKKKELLHNEVIWTKKGIDERWNSEERKY